MENSKKMSYLGNMNLKASNAEIQFTPEMVQEFMKCANDPQYFAETYIKIVHVDKGLIPMKLFPYQKTIIDLITNNRRVVANTSRQAGKTTTAVAVILHYVLFNQHKTVALLANKGDTAREILDRIKIAYEALPKWLQQGVVEWNKGSVELENGCKIIAGSTSSSAIRGKSVSFLYIDEAAFIENWEDFFQSVYPTISSGETTKILLTSTPNGLNHFFSFVQGAKDNRNGYKWIEVPWDQIPGRSESWKQDTLESMNNDLQKFEVEFNCRFEGSSGTLIDGDTLKSLYPENPIHDKNGMKIYEMPVQGHTYVLTSDVSRGKGLDYSALQVLDVTKMPYIQVAVFRDNMITPADYAETVHRISKQYNDAHILIEINDIGEQVAEIIQFDYESENLLFTESSGRSGKRISGGYGKNVDKGLRTTKTTKALGCNLVKLMIEQKQLILKDKDTIEELKSFSRKGNSYEAESGKHDDLVMGLVLFGWLTDQTYFKEMTDINTVMVLREKSEDEIMESITPFYNLNDIYEDDFSPKW